MKKLVITISLLAGATAAYSQGELNWSDYQGAAGSLPAFSIEIFAPGAGGPGNTSADFPAGNATYAGAPLSGAGFTVGLYDGLTASAVQNAVSSGTPIATDNFTSGFGGRWDVSGGNPATTAVDSQNASGTAVFVEIAAWNNDGATIGSYAAAIAGGQPAGNSGPSSGTTTLGGGGSPPAIAGTLAGIGITDFALSTIPEPSTIALGVIGASTFLLRLRRKQ